MKNSGLPFLPREIDTGIDLSKMSEQMDGDLNRIFKRLWPDDNYSRFCTLVDRAVDIDFIDRRQIARYWLGCGVSEKADPLKVYFFFACLYHRSALEVLALGRKERTLTLFIRAVKQVGRIDGYLHFVEQVEIALSGPIKGGQKNMYFRWLVGEHLIGLLNDAPKEGWQSKEKTARNLELILDKFIVSRGFGKIVPDAYNFIVAALKREGKPREVYLSKRMAKKT